MLIALLVVLSYLVGSIPFGYLVARAVRGIDIRQHGSGNIGATNVGRVLGLKWFFVVFLLDFLKAAIPVALLMYGYWPGLVPEGWPNAAAAALAGLVILLGNMLPLYIGFRGGKGAATGTGVILPLAPLPAAAALLAAVVLFFWTRYVSIASIGAVLAVVATHLVYQGSSAWDREMAPVTWLILIGAALVIFRHRSNIRRLLQGTERRVPTKSERRHAMSPQRQQGQET